MGGATHRLVNTGIFHFYFNPRSPWGERQVTGLPPRLNFPFQSTLPVGGATRSKVYHPHQQSISIHAPRGGSDDGQDSGGHRGAISIHAPRGGSDCSVHLLCDVLLQFQSTLPVGGATPVPFTVLFPLQISIHAPRGGSDLQLLLRVNHHQIFQSTLPVGGATIPGYPDGLPQLISIHAPRGGSDCTTS